MEAEIYEREIKSKRLKDRERCASPPAICKAAKNTVYMAMYCQDNTNTPVDISWTCFKVGWNHRHLVLVDHLELRGWEIGELVMEYPQPGGGGESRSM